MIPKRTRRELRGAIIGMVMGDASLYQNRFRDGSAKGNYKFSFSHSRRQIDYAVYKQMIIQELFDYQLEIRETLIKLKNTDKIYPAVRLMTRVHPRLKMIAKNIYINGKKRITDWTLNNITTEGLALWWQDDGCVHRNKPPKTGGSIVWGTYGFPKEDVEKFQLFLFTKYGIELRIRKHKKSGGYYLSRGLSVGLKFSEIINPFVVPSMEYKLVKATDFKQGPYKI